MVGTDMAVGKMTAGLELTRSLREMSRDAVFLATGQTGIAITGQGIPLDAIRVDHAGGAVERMVLEAAHHEIVVIEGQGSLLHPGSTATLPLMRGSCATHMILCHRAGMETLDGLDHVRIPPLREVDRPERSRGPRRRRADPGPSRGHRAEHGPPDPAGGRSCS
jgi:uncharacterized NAD-dependent epimerase/dehydratase family protein